MANAINDDGDVVGSAWLANQDVNRAFLWKKGVMTALESLPGDSEGAASGRALQVLPIAQQCHGGGLAAAGRLYQYCGVGGSKPGVAKCSYEFSYNAGRSAQ
jgi:probable HAF family extracellular repeat protein